jgi:GTP cyclohydrolase III
MNKQEQVKTFAVQLQEELDVASKALIAIASGYRHPMTLAHRALDTIKDSRKNYRKERGVENG